jgi:hypothetical protein
MSPTENPTNPRLCRQFAGNCLSEIAIRETLAGRSAATTTRSRAASSASIGTDYSSIASDRCSAVAMRPRTSSTVRAPRSVSMDSSGLAPPNAQFVRLNHRVAVSSLRCGSDAVLSQFLKIVAHASGTGLRPGFQFWRLAGARSIFGTAASRPAREEKCGAKITACM